MLGHAFELGCWQLGLYHVGFIKQQQCFFLYGPRYRRLIVHGRFLYDPLSIQIQHGFEFNICGRAGGGVDSFAQPMFANVVKYGSVYLHGTEIFQVWQGLNV